ncbi:MAG: methyltransferase domain-containing protein [Candidatus Zixiibacteriota bacterium]
MAEETNKKDWSKDYLREMLVHQRQFMWYEDTLDKFSAWLKFRPGMTVIDVGCGLGYLGYAYWPYFGKGGKYIGVDQSVELINDAREASREWSRDGVAEFTRGDAYKLPLPEDFADAVMCQTLLMHLDRPEAALAEMIRVAKPGGLVICFEPDNLSAMMARPFHSLPEFDLDEILLMIKINLISYRGRLKLGEGDNNIGSKVPHMMKQGGLINIDIRMSDRVFYLEPPYETPVQQHRIKGMKSRWLNDKNFDFLLEEQKKEFLAGGGDPAEFEKSIPIIKRLREDIRRQLENNEYYMCGGTQFYIIKGMKPQ